VLKMAAACGAVATLDKPFTLEQLRDTVEPLLPAPNHYRINRERQAHP
jgi:DNA-binding NtrC family response regulator